MQVLDVVNLLAAINRDSRRQVFVEEFALIVADNDQGASRVILSLLDKYRASKVPVEAHILSGGNHGFNMGYRSNLKAVRDWPHLMANWMDDMHLLGPRR